MQNNPFFLFLIGLIASVTEEETKAHADLLKPAGPEYIPLGTLDVELQKLWIVIQNLTKEANEAQDEGQHKIKHDQAKLAESFFTASVRSQFGWEKNPSINKGWQVSDKMPCPRCKQHHPDYGMGDLDFDDKFASIFGMVMRLGVDRTRH